MASFGHFSKDGREYIIEQPLAPIRHLINFCWNGSVVSGVNQFGTGEGVFNNVTLLYNNPDGRCRMIRDGHRYFYVRDEESGTYWNTGCFPVKHEPYKFTATYGTGYSRYIHETENIKTDALCYVASDEPVEIWRINFENLGDTPRTLKLYPYVEWLLTGYDIKSDYYSYLLSEYYDDINTIVGYNTADERPHERYNGFVSSNIKPSGYTGSAREFMGTYGEPSRPRNVAEGVCSNKPTCNENLAGALEIPVKLGKGEKKEVVVIIGSTSDITETRRLVKKILDRKYLDECLDLLMKSKDNIINHTVINTPDEKINRMVNIWAKMQIQLCAEFGRDGVKGFRDTLQDAWGITSFWPELGKEKMLETFRYQYKEGWALRGYMPATYKHYSDSTTWILPAITEYIKHTGDTAVLDEVIPYFDEGEGTVLDHIIRALRYLNKDKGEHGLCLAHMGDWNDSLNWMGVKGKGESVMTSMAHYRCLKLFSELINEVDGDPALIKEMDAAAEEIKKSIETYAWDGEWYLEGYSDYGRKVGSKENEQGRIYMVPQAWAVISGAGSSERIDKSVRAVEEKLDSKTGMVMCWPAFTKRDEHVGRLTIMLPGMYENASTYCHGSGFMIAAYLLLGKANEALKLYRKVLPDSDNHPSDLSGVEPYAFTNQYLGRDNLRAGVSVSGWITGTAGWMYRDMVNLMVGFQPDYKGVYIKPCIPDEWNDMSISTTLRGVKYNVKITRSCCGKGMTVNGKAAEGNYIPYGGEKEYDVEVRI
jgi:cellobiose phosphorylase